MVDRDADDAWGYGPSTPWGDDYVEEDDEEEDEEEDVGVGSDLWEEAQFLASVELAGPGPRSIEELVAAHEHPQFEARVALELRRLHSRVSPSTPARKPARRLVARRVRVRRRARARSPGRSADDDGESEPPNGAVS